MDSESKNDNIKRLIFRKTSSKDRYIYYSMITIFGIILIVSSFATINEMSFWWIIIFTLLSILMIVKGIRGMKRNVKKT